MSARKRRSERAEQPEKSVWQLSESDLLDRFQHALGGGQREATPDPPPHFEDLDQSSIHPVRAGDDSFFFDGREGDNTLFLKSLLSATVKPYIPKYFTQGRDEAYLLDDYKSRVYNVLREGRGSPAPRKPPPQSGITLEDLTRDCLMRVDALFTAPDFSLAAFLLRFFKPQSVVAHVASYFMDLLDQIDSALIFNNMSKFGSLIASIANFDAIDARLEGAVGRAEMCRAAAGGLVGELLPRRLRLGRLQCRRDNAKRTLALLRAASAARDVRRAGLAPAPLFEGCRRLIDEAGYPHSKDLEGLACLAGGADELTRALASALRRQFSASFWSLLAGSEATTGPLFDAQRVEECFRALHYHLELCPFPFADFAKDVFEQVEYRNAVYAGYLKTCDPSAPRLAADVHRHLRKFSKSMLTVCERARKLVKTLHKKVLLESVQNRRGFDFVLRFKSVLQNFFVFIGNC